MAYLPLIIFLFLLGSCVGSFLNVVVWRLPREESLSHPGSHCPKCNTPLKWYDNIPIFGWLKLGGRCRTCREPISKRYPIVETATALLFVLYFVAFFFFQKGPCVHAGLSESHAASYPRALEFTRDWPIYFLDMYLLSALLAASLIDAELFIIPPVIVWGWQGGVALVAIFVHTLVDVPREPGALNIGPTGAALAAGGTLGFFISLLLMHTGKLPRSFAEGGPMLEVEKEELARKKTLKPDGSTRDESEPPPREYSPAEIRAEMRIEMKFLLPPMCLAALWVLLIWQVPVLGRAWTHLIVETRWLSALLGTLLGGLIGGFVVWFTRIAGSYVFGREAMGMGDVDLMAGVGFVIGAGAATVAFFIAPFFGIILALYMLVTKSRRELPYGPYLSMATAFVIIFYCPIADYLTPGILGLSFILRHLFGG